MNNMEKIFKIISNSMLMVFLLGVMIVPIASMGFMGVKPQEKNVLSVQDVRCPIEVRETTESTCTCSIDSEKVNN
jgi:hypothetical protein